MIRADESSYSDGGMGPAGHRVFLGSSALLFIASVATTIYLCQSMPGGMAMPGGWIMSMAWMKMPGQSWLASTASFLGMWVVMMVAMMLPSLVLELLRYRLALRELETIRRSTLAALTGVGYFLVWTILGMALYPVGMGVARVAMTSAPLARAMPVLTSLVLLLAGAFQFTTVKARLLSRCRTPFAHRQAPAPNVRDAWGHGIRLGAACALCCAGLMVALLAAGVMNLGAMAVITVAVTAERLWSAPERAAHATGFVLVAAAVIMLGRALDAS